MRIGYGSVSATVMSEEGRIHQNINKWHLGLWLFVTKCFLEVLWACRPWIRISYERKTG